MYAYNIRNKTHQRNPERKISHVTNNILDIVSYKKKYIENLEFDIIVATATQKMEIKLEKEKRGND